MRRPVFGHVLGYMALTVILTAGAAQSLSGTNTVDSGDIIDGQVATSDIRNNSVTGAKILDNTVTDGDLGLVRVWKDYNPAPAASFAVRVPCPSGKILVAGGGELFPMGIAFMTSSEPMDDFSWVVRWRTVDGATVDPSHMEGWAVCSKD